MVHSWHWSPSHHEYQPKNKNNSDNNDNRNAKMPYLDSSRFLLLKTDGSETKHFRDAGTIDNNGCFKEQYVDKRS